MTPVTAKLVWKVLAVMLQRDDWGWGTQGHTSADPPVKARNLWTAVRKAEKGKERDWERERKRERFWKRKIQECRLERKAWQCGPQRHDLLPGEMYIHSPYIFLALVSRHLYLFHWPRAFCALCLGQLGTIMHCLRGNFSLMTVFWSIHLTLYEDLSVQGRIVKSAMGF